MSALGTFNARYLDSEMMGKSRAIAAIEQIQADAVPVAVLKAALIVKRPNSCFVLAVSVGFPIGAHREFPLIQTERLACVAEARVNMFVCENVKTAFFPSSFTLTK